MTSRLGTGKSLTFFYSVLGLNCSDNGPCLARFGEGEAASNNSWFLCCGRPSLLLILPSLFLVLLLVVLLLAGECLLVGGGVGPLRAVG